MTQTLAYVVAIVVLLCFLVGGILGIVIREGDVEKATPLITSLVGLFGPTIGILVLLIRQQHNITDVQQTKELVNNHLNGDPPHGPAT